MQRPVPDPCGYATLTNRVQPTHYRPRGVEDRKGAHELRVDGAAVDRETGRTHPSSVPDETAQMACDVIHEAYGSVAIRSHA